MTDSPARVDVHHRVVLPVLVVLTVITGIVDAVSFLGLGQVFVAVMTGNVVFAGLAISGAPGIALLEPLVALTAFLLAAVMGGRLISRLSGHRGRVLFGAIALKLVFVVCAVVVAALFLDGGGRTARLVVIILLASGMALQNAGVRHLGVRDFTTTLLTLTLTGVAADSRLAGGQGGKPARRWTSVAALLAGAVVGGFLVLRFGVAWPMTLVALLLTLVLAVIGHRLRATVAEDWLEPGR